MELCYATQELREKYISRIPNPKIYADQIWPANLITPEKLESLKDFEVTESDVVLASYPKSGTTWASEILSALAYEGEIEQITKNKLDERVPWLELDGSTWRAKIWYVWKVKYFTTPPPPAKFRVFFTHLPLHLLPRGILEGKCKLIYVARNPKDQAVSFYHFHKMARFLGAQSGIDLPWNEFFPVYFSGATVFGDWFKHVLGYWNFTKNNAKTKFIKYEEMKADLSGIMKELEDFVGVPLSEEARARVVQHCSFDSMKDNKMANRDGVPVFDQSKEKFMRKGIVGDWKNHFTVAQNKAFESLYHEKMSDSDLQFDFDQFSSLSEASAQFGVDVLRVSSKPSESFVLSPHSLGSALAIVHDAARGNSKKQLTTLLAKNDISSSVTSHYSTLIKNLASSKDVTSDVANRFFVDKRFSIKSGYALHVRKQYSADVEQLDFVQEEESAKRVNAFVSNETHGMIKEIVTSETFEDDAVAVLINAVYFKGDWMTHFSAENTRGRIFYGIDGKRKISFVHNSDLNCQYKFAPGLSVLSLPYKDPSYSMVIVMPDADFPSWREKLTGYELLSALKDLKSGKVNVHLPKFNIESELDGIESLKKLGVRDIFSMRANFGEMSNMPIYVSSIIHKAVIDVAEKRTSAAAATSVSFGFLSGTWVPVSPIAFAADRPFLYGIVRNNNFIFLGQLC